MRDGQSGSRTSLSENGRYRLVCVAPEVPGRGAYDDLDEAIANSDAHFEVFDTVTGRYVGAYCQEDHDEAVARWKAKCRA